MHIIYDVEKQLSFIFTHVGFINVYRIWKVYLTEFYAEYNSHFYQLLSLSDFKDWCQCKFNEKYFILSYEAAHVEKFENYI
jgi:hypothetical protein